MPTLLETYWPGLAAVVSRASDLLAPIPTQFWAGLYVLWLVSAVIFIVSQRRAPAATLAWIIGFLSLPLIGALVYYFFGPRKLKRRRMRRSLAKQLAAQAIPFTRSTLPDAFTDSCDIATIARVAMCRDDPGPVRASHIAILPTGDATFQVIEQAIEQAFNHIHIEYYIFEPDIVGTRWRDALVAAGRRGVKVRVLLDAIGSKNCTDAFWQPVVDGGGSIRYFNPLRLFQFKAGKMNFRTHRKIVVIDGKTAFTGGVNVDDINSEQLKGAGAWRDTHLRIDGPPACDLQVIFLEDWLFADDVQSPWIHPDRSMISAPDDVTHWFPTFAKPTGPWVQIIDSGPDEATPDIHHFFFTAITLAQQRVWITTPYFVPDESMLVALTTAAARGVDVRLIIPAKGDSWLVTAAASTYADEVAKLGTQVFSYGPRMNHAKTMVVDDELAVVGTANMDNRSFRLNFEVIAAVYDRTVNQELAELFEQDLVHAQAVTPGALNKGFLRRLTASGARLFAPLL